MGRIGFGLAALASIGFGAWFLFINLDAPGMSFAIALILMPLLISLFGLSKVKREAITRDGKAAGWAAIVIALLGAGYVTMFFSSWLIIAVVWLALHVPLGIAIVSSPTYEGW